MEKSISILQNRKKVLQEKRSKSEKHTEPCKLKKSICNFFYL